MQPKSSLYPCCDCVYTTQAFDIKCLPSSKDII